MAAALVDLPRENELWSGSRQTLEERMEYFVGNETLSDMTFRVGEERRLIPGHKLILSSCSWDFYNALHLLRVDNNELPIEDVTADEFLVFLRYCYTGKVNLTVENGANILKLAYRFEMKPLIQQCERELQQMIGAETCMNFLSLFNFLPKDSSLRMTLLKMVTEEFLLFSETQILPSLPLTIVEEIVNQDSLPCDEVTTFKALMKWSALNCERADIPVIPKNFRRILKGAFYKIRFPTMFAEDFKKILAEYPGLLSENEIFTICRKIVTGNSGLFCIFSDIKRKAEKLVIPWALLDSEERELLSTCSIIPPNPNDTGSVLTFRVDFQVKVQKKLMGFALIMRKNNPLKLCNSDFCIPCETCGDIYNINCNCKSLKASSGSLIGPYHSLSHAFKDYCIVPVLFDKALTVNPDGRYKLVTLPYPDTFKGFPALKVVRSTSPASNVVILETFDQRPIIPFLFFAK